MAHSQQLEYIQIAHDICFPNAPQKVLEIGSYDVNGSIRSIFKDSAQYIGVDLAEGPGVDLVSSGDKVQYPDNHFDAVLSCECFEHNPFWEETFRNMVRMLRPHGLALVTCASTGRGEHGTLRTDPSVSPGTFSVGINYYRNLTKRDFVKHFPLETIFSSYDFFYNRRSKDLYFVGFKRGQEPPSIDVKSVNKAYSAAIIQRISKKGAGHVLAARVLDFSTYFGQFLLPTSLFEKYVLWIEALALRKGRI